MTILQRYGISDLLAEFIGKQGYCGYSLSETHQITTSNFDANKSRLPLKTLAVHAGCGWIGKNNLLVNKGYGCCQTWGGVLTDAPLITPVNSLLAVQCGSCRTCLEVCRTGVLRGTIWHSGIEREAMIDVDKCTTCLKCMVHCSWTKKYIRKRLGTYPL